MPSSSCVHDDVGVEAEGLGDLLEQLADAIDWLRHQRRLPERFFLRRGGAGGGPVGLPSGALPSRRPLLPPLLPPLAPAPAVAGVAEPPPRKQIAEAAEPAVLSRWSHRAEPLPDDRLLRDRPQVGRDPVEQQAGREAHDEGDEQERQREEDHPLRAVGRRGHQQRRRQLRPDVEDDQDDQHGAGRLVRQVRDEEEARVAAVAARLRVRRPWRVDLRADVVPQVRAQHVEQRQEDRELRRERETRRKRVDLVLPVELHHLLVEALLVVLVALLELLHLGRVGGQRLHRLELLERQRQQARAHEDGHGDDRPAPAVEHARGSAGGSTRRRRSSGWKMFARRKITGGDEGRRNKVWAETGSYPPWLNGLQRSSRHAASTEPRSMP